MIKTLIVEDEKAAYENLKRFLEIIDPSIKITAWLKSVDTTVEWLKNNDAPNLIFLDIQLSDGNSFEIFEQVSINSPIIFTTAYDQYALKAFELHSVDYLLKPIAKDRLAKAVDKFKETQKTPSNNLSEINLLIEKLKKEENYKDRFLVKKGTQLISIPIEKIAYFFVDEITLLTTTDGKKFTINFSLDKLNELLNPKHFFRLNRKVITHYQAINYIARYSDAKLKVMLQPEPNFDIIISKEKASKFKKWLE